MSHLTDLEIGWLAGIVDGEGGIYLTVNKSDNVHLHLKIEMCHEDTIKKIFKLFGTGCIYCCYRKTVTGKSVSKWAACGKEALFALNLIVHALVTKKKHAELAIKFMEECFVGYGNGNKTTYEKHTRALNCYQEMKGLNN